MQRIRSHSEYIKILSDWVKENDKRALESGQINLFIRKYSVYDTDYMDVKRDSYEISKRLQNNIIEKKVINHDQYVEILKKELKDNDFKMLNQWQVDRVLWWNNLYNDFGITSKDVYKDMEKILIEVSENT